MLLWQPQNSLRIRSVFLVSLVLHVFVCCTLLFVYKDYHQRLVIDLSSRIPSNAIVKLLPLSASRPSSSIVGVKGGKKGGISLSAKGNQGRQKSSNKNSAQSSALPVASNQKKKKSPTSLVKQAVTSKSVKVGKAKKEALEKAKKAAKTKKTSVAKAKEDKQKLKEQNELKKKEAEKLKQDEKLDLEKKASDSAKAFKEKKEVAEKESKPVQQLLKEEQKIEALQQPVIDQATLGETSGSSVGPEGQEILYLTKQEFDALQIQQKLKECLFDLWTPPAGIPSGVLCEVLITVGWDGAILETQFLKKTEILMYDLSVQETLEQVAFPHEVWGKQITIAFKP
jgi:hypothetical protein